MSMDEGLEWETGTEMLWVRVMAGVAGDNDPQEPNALISS